MQHPTADPFSLAAVINQNASVFHYETVSEIQRFYCKYTKGDIIWYGRCMTIANISTAGTAQREGLGGL